MIRKNHLILNNRLEEIVDPSFLKDLSVKELKKLAEEIRLFLIEEISKTGGHLASNLGAVELSIALHYVFNSPFDDIIFDVSHQIYTHKILTGRAREFKSLRKHQGLSGYANYQESIHDKWESGHAGTSISALMGYLKANQLKGIKNEAVALVGDASITNGTNMEALNILASEKDLKGIIVINDNKMSISGNVGSFSKILAKMRGSKFFNKIKRAFKKITPKFIYNFLSKVKRGFKAFIQSTNIFEDMGYVYLGPIDGNNLDELIRTFKQAKKLKKSVVIHTVTKKGKGYPQAENDNDGKYHGVGPFDLDRGLKVEESSDISWSEAISLIIEDLTTTNDIYVIMPAMLVGSKFLNYQEKHPQRIIDVGIAEEHAAVMASAMALNGINVFLAYYSTFSQRAFDQILNDIARPNIRVVIGIDRAGFVGEDGSTHQGIYDVSMFLSMPNVIITMPRNIIEAYGLLKYAYQQNKPFVIRYPRGTTNFVDFKETSEIKPSWELICKGTLGVIISYGPVLTEIEELLKSNNLNYSICNARFIRPIDEQLLRELLINNQKIVVYEEIHASGSLYQLILDYCAKNDFYNEVIAVNAYNKVIDQGTVLENKATAKISLTDLLEVL